MLNRFNYPYLGFGLGLRQPHYDYILERRPREVDWFEVISENFIEAHQGYWEFLRDLRNDYPIVLHGVSLSIGSTDPLNTPYLEKLKELATYLEAPWVSDHLCWTGVHGQNTHDLLPVPYTEEALTHIIHRVKEVQDRLERHLLLENPSSYLSFREADMPEWEFMARLTEEANCGLLLDVNNVYVSSINHRYDPKTYLDAMPADRIIQIHLAGHRNHGTHIVDTHDDYVIDEVWELYTYTIKKFGNITTMVEWDDNIPEFAVLAAELEKAKHYSRSMTEVSDAGNRPHHVAEDGNVI